MINIKITKVILSLIIISETMSALGYFLPPINTIGFLIVFIATLILSFKKLEYGVYLSLGELFIGSMGKMFYLEVNGVSLSIRIAIWAAVMLVWLIKTIIIFVNSKKLSIAVIASKHWKYYLFFFFFILLGCINGFIHKNNLSNIFFDFNGWLFFAYVFPWYDVLSSSRRKEVLENIIAIFIVCCFWLSIKTLFLLFLFSHKTTISIYGLYYWMRKNQLGEITQMKSDFFRIFIQSQIYVLCGFFFVMSSAIKNKINYKILLLNSLFISVILISFSRSFWVGAFFGGLILIFFCWQSFGKNYKKYISYFIFAVASVIISILVIVAVVKIPLPGSNGGQYSLNLLTERASQVSGEDGASSRWSLLPELWKKISKSPLIGLGYGTTVTYKSSDPRVLSLNPNGLYTTFAFEWGWLDIWLKIGLIGLIIYLALSFVIIKDCWTKIVDGQQLDWLYRGAILSIAAIFAVSFFSPYTNHPLGIGFLILIGAISNSNKESN